MMAINEADILRQLGANDIGKKSEDVYKDMISELADDIMDSFRETLRKNSKGSGTLGQSFVAKPKRNGFEIGADFYYDFIDEGVKAAPLPSGVKPIRSQFTGASRFSFKNLKVGSRMERSIAEWTGKPIGQNYGVAVSIKKHGIAPKNITDSVITDELLERISEDLASITGLAVQATFEKVTSK